MPKPLNSPEPLDLQKKFYHLFVDVIGPDMTAIIVKTGDDNITCIDDEYTKGVWYWSETLLLANDIEAVETFKTRFAFHDERLEIFKQFNITL